MSVQKNIEKQLTSINSSTSYSLYSTIKKNNNDTLIYNYINNEESYYIYSKSKISQNEKKVFEILFSETNLNNKYNTQHNKTINNIFKKDLTNLELERNLKKLNIDKKDNIIVASLKIEKEDILCEAFEILINIEGVDLLTIFNGKIILLLTNKTETEAFELSKLMVELIEIETLENIKIGISSLDLSINIKKLYRESIDSIRLSEKFNLEKNIYNFSELFIYKIISFIRNKEMNSTFKYIHKYKVEKLNKEEIKTAKKFLEHNLNISEAAKNLYIHRNTLIYRLDKIKKITKIDLRNFNDALKFKTLLIIYGHIHYNKRK